MTDTPKVTTWHDLYKEKPVQPAPAKETAQWILDLDFNHLPKNSIERRRRVWQQLNPGQALPPELEVQA